MPRGAIAPATPVDGGLNRAECSLSQSHGATYQDSTAVNII